MIEHGLEILSLGPDPDEHLTRHLQAVRPFKAAHLPLNFHARLLTLCIIQLGQRLLKQIAAVLEPTANLGIGWKTTLHTDRMHDDTGKASVSESFLKHMGFVERKTG